MKTIKYVVAGLAIAGLAVSSYAGTIEVDWGAQNNAYMTDNSGAAGYLVPNDLLEIGTFASAPTVGSPSLVGFSVFATGSINNGVGSFVLADPAIETGFTHSQIYIVAYNTPTVTGNSQLAIFDVSDASNNTWKFPASSDVPSSTAFDVQSMFASPGSDSIALAPGAQMIYGTVGLDAAGPYQLIETESVPEPSSIALVVLGLLGGIGLIRRRS